MTFESGGRARRRAIALARNERTLNLARRMPREPVLYKEAVERVLFIGPIATPCAARGSTDPGLAWARLGA